MDLMFQRSYKMLPNRVSMHADMTESLLEMSLDKGSRENVLGFLECWSETQTADLGSNGE